MGRKVGVIDVKGKVLVRAIYDQIVFADKNFIYVTNNQAMGVLSIKDTKLLVPIEYQNIRKITFGFVAYSSGYKGTLYDEEGKRVSKAIYNPSLNFPAWGNEEEGFFVYNKSNKKFYSYQNIIDFENEISSKRQLFYKRGNKWGFMDTTGRETSPPLFDDIDRDYLRYYNGNKGDLFVAWLNSKRGIVNTKGKILLPMEHDIVTVDRNSIIVVQGSKFGFLGTKLRKAVHAKYDSVVVTHSYEYNRSAFFNTARINNKWALLNDQGDEITPFKYDSFQWFYHKLAVVKVDGKYGIINLHGKQITPCIYDEMAFAGDSNGQVIVKKGIYFGVLDSLGKEVAPVIYNRIVMLKYPFAGKYRVMYQGNIGLLDGASKRILIPCEFDDIKFYGNESNYGDSYHNYRGNDLPPLIALKNGNWGLIDLTGKERLPFIFYKIYIGENSNYFVTTYDGKEGVFNKNFKEVIPPNYNDIRLIHPGIYIVRNLTNYGLIDTNGVVIAEGIYQSINLCGDKFVLKKGDKFGAMDLKGQIILPFKYAGIDCSNGKLNPHD